MSYNNYKWSKTLKNCESLYCIPATYIKLYCMHLYMSATPQCFKNFKKMVCLHSVPHLLHKHFPSASTDRRWDPDVNAHSLTPERKAMCGGLNGHTSSGHPRQPNCGSEVNFAKEEAPHHRRGGVSGAEGKSWT